MYYAAVDKKRDKITDTSYRGILYSDKEWAESVGEGANLPVFEVSPLTGSLNLRANIYQGDKNIKSWTGVFELTRELAPVKEPTQAAQVSSSKKITEPSSRPPSKAEMSEERWRRYHGF